MTDVGCGFMPLDRQLFDRSLAELVAAFLAQKYRTAKEIARAVKIDVSTAENLRKGHLSITTFQKVIAAEGRELWEKLGDELFGESFYQFEERRLNTKIREAEDARSNLVRLRARSQELPPRPRLLDDAGLGRMDDPIRREAHGEGFGVDRKGDHGPARQGHRKAPLEPRSFVEPARPSDLRSPPGMRGRT